MNKLHFVRDFVHLTGFGDVSIEKNIVFFTRNFRSLKEENYILFLEKRDFAKSNDII